MVESLSGYFFILDGDMLERNIVRDDPLEFMAAATSNLSFLHI